MHGWTEFLMLWSHVTKNLFKLPNHFFLSELREYSRACRLPHLFDRGGTLDKSLDAFRQICGVISFHEPSGYSMLYDFRQTPGSVRNNRTAVRTSLHCDRWERVAQRTWHNANIQIAINPWRVRLISHPMKAIAES